MRHGGSLTAGRKKYEKNPFPNVFVSLKQIAIIFMEKFIAQREIRSFLLAVLVEWSV